MLFWAGASSAAFLSNPPVHANFENAAARLSSYGPAIQGLQTLMTGQTGQKLQARFPNLSAACQKNPLFLAPAIAALESSDQEDLAYVQHLSGALQEPLLDRLDKGRRIQIFDLSDQVGQWLPDVLQQAKEKLESPGTTAHELSHWFYQLEKHAAYLEDLAEVYPSEPIRQAAKALSEKKEEFLPAWQERWLATSREMGFQSDDSEEPVVPGRPIHPHIYQALDRGDDEVTLSYADGTGPEKSLTRRRDEMRADLHHPSVVKITLIDAKSSAARFELKFEEGLAEDRWWELLSQVEQSGIRVEENDRPWWIILNGNAALIDEIATRYGAVKKPINP